jgi:hypothetical protein
MIRLFLILLLIFSFSAKTEEIPETTKPQLFNAKKPVLCDTPDKIIEIIKSYDEHPYLKFDGVSPSSDGQFLKTTIVLGYNKETKTWSLVEFVNENTACIIGNGRGMQLVKQPFGLNT